MPAADTDVDVVALRKDPGVAARHSAELDDHATAIALARIRRVSLIRDAVHHVAAETERASSGAVRSVGDDDGTRRDLLTVDAKCVGPHVAHLHPVPELRARRRSTLCQIRVEPPS